MRRYQGDDTRMRVGDRAATSPFRITPGRRLRHGCHDLAGRRTPTQMPTPVQRCRQEQREIGKDAVCDHLRRSRRQISAMAGAGFHLSH